MRVPPRIVVVGSSNTDMVVEAGRLPAPGETVLGGAFLMAAGGKGANQAVAAARLGATVELVGRVGADVFGDRAIADLERQGVATRRVVRDSDAASGVALIVVGPDGENQIAVAPGANARLSVADVEAAADDIAAADLLLLQLEVPLASVRRAAEVARGAGTRTILDPAPAPSASEGGLDDQLLGRVSILTPNATEAERLTGVAIRDAASAEHAATALRRRGVETVIVTLGAAGCLLSSDDGTRTVPAPRVEAVDATAAGDTFNGALAWALAGGRSIDEAAELACRAAALSVTGRGAQPSMPDRRALLERG